MSDRAISTVVDVAVCLLLVSAAVVTLVGAPSASPDPAADAADETATLLGSTTATVHYSLGDDVRGVDDPSFPNADGRAFDRSANGTLAELLAAAAVANLSVDGEHVSPVGDDFLDAVRNATRPLVSGPEWDGQVIVEWRPYRDAHLGGTVVVGSTPPPDADVYTARMRVSSGFPSVHDAGAVARGDDFDAVATVVADGIVGGLFPPERVEPALQGPYPESRLAALRYGRFATLYDAPVRDALDDFDVDRANGELRNAIGRAVETDLRATFETPDAAGKAVRVGTVEITVRTWSR